MSSTSPRRCDPRLPGPRSHPALRGSFFLSSAAAFALLTQLACSERTRPVKPAEPSRPAAHRPRPVPPRMGRRPRADAPRAERAIRQALLIKHGSDALAAGRPEVALAHLRKAADLLPSSARAAEIQTLVGRAYEAMKRPQQALAAYEKAVALAPDNPAGHYVLALAYEEAARPARALQAIRKAIQLAPRNLAYRFDLVTIELRLGKKAEADRAYSEYERRRDDLIAQMKAGPLRKRLLALDAVGAVLADARNRAALAEALRAPALRLRIAAARALVGCPVPDRAVGAALEAQLAKEQDPEARKALRAALARLPTAPVPRGAARTPPAPSPPRPRRDP